MNYDGKNDLQKILSSLDETVDTVLDAEKTNSPEDWVRATTKVKQFGKLCAGTQQALTTVEHMAFVLGTIGTPAPTLGWSFLIFSCGFFVGIIYMRVVNR